MTDSNLQEALALGNDKLHHQSVPITMQEALALQVDKLHEQAEQVIHSHERCQSVRCRSRE